MTRVIGIDPGYGRLGWGVVDDNGDFPVFVHCGVIETPSSLPFSQRLKGIKAAVLKLLQDFHPDCVAVEKPVHGPNVTNSVEVGAAFGAVLLAGEEYALAFIRTYWPSEVKAAVLKGNAKKKEVQVQVALLLSLPKIPRPDDAADALAVAICGANRYVVDGLEQVL